MRVLIMGTNDSSGGGLIVHYITLAQYLQKLGYDIMCININDDGNLIFKEKNVVEINIPYKPLLLYQKLIKFISLRKAIVKAKVFNPDIFVAVGLGYGYAMIAKALSATTFKIFEEVHFEAIADPLRLKMIKCFDAIAVQTKGMISPFLTNVSSLKPVAFLPCFSKEYAVNDFEQALPVQNNIRLAYFGRLAWNKGLKQFIKGTNVIFKNNPNLTFDIYGRGPEIKVIQEEINTHNLQNQIHLNGFFEDAEFPALISSFHGIILPSVDTEGLPLILIEAMRFGRPVFATQTGAMPEVASINADGMIISEKDALSLAKNLSIFINNIRQEKYKACAIHDIYKQYFSNDIFIKTWITMFENPRKYFARTSNKCII